MGRGQEEGDGQEGGEEGEVTPPPKPKEEETGCGLLAFCFVLIVSVLGVIGFAAVRFIKWAWELW